MNSNVLISLLEQIEGEYNHKKKLIFGTNNGYNYYVRLDEKSNTFALVVNAYGDGETLVSTLKDFAQKYENIDDISYESMQIKIRFIPYVEEGKTVTSIYNFFNQTVLFSSKNNYLNVCNRSKRIGDHIALFENNNGEKLFLSEDVVKVWNEEEERNYLEQINRPYPFYLALIAALILALPGIGIWMLAYREGIAISGIIGGSLMAIGAYGGFYLVAKMFDKKAFVSIIIMTLILLIIGQFAAYQHFLYNLLIELEWPDIKNYFDTLPHFFEAFQVQKYTQDFVFSSVEALLSISVITIFFYTPSYKKKANAYGAKPILPDVKFIEEEEETNDNNTK